MNDCGDTNDKTFRAQATQCSSLQNNQSNSMTICFVHVTRKFYIIITILQFLVMIMIEIQGKGTACKPD